MGANGAEGDHTIGPQTPRVSAMPVGTSNTARQKTQDVGVVTTERFPVVPALLERELVASNSQQTAPLVGHLPVMGWH